MSRVQGPANPFESFRREDVEQSIPARFAQWVARSPGKVAVSGEDRSFTYAELDAVSTRVARALVSHLGASPEPIALVMDQGVESVIAILAVLKAGKFYVPLDSDQRDHELTGILEDCGVRLLLTEAGHLERSGAICAGTELTTLTIDEFLEANPEDAPPLEIDVGPESLAYIFYTSGSTGEPKGVFDNQRNVLHNILRYTNTLHITSTDRLSLLQSPAFSGTVSSLFGALLNGATVCPRNLRETMPTGLAEWINDQGITIYHSVPALFRSFLEGGRSFPSVRLIRLEGDRASKRDVELFRRHFSPDCLLVNGLGITETGLVRQFFLDRQTAVASSHIPVGYPVDDVECLVLDESGAPVRAGDAGEIVIRSDFLALGYWQNPDLTQRAFSDDPEVGPRRRFHTRDLGRLHADGCLEHLGRTDFRIKLRGQWVDLDRVEAALNSLPSVDDAVAVGREDPHGDLQIVGYVVQAANTSPSASELRRALLEQLPAVMVPSRYVFVDALPLTAHQKVDRSALPEPSWRAHEVDIPPWTLLEQQVAEVWQDLLGIDAVGLRDDFFDLGGHSLLAVRMLDEIEQMFGTRIPPSFLLSGATIEHLSRALMSDSAIAAAPITCLNAGCAGPPFHFFHGDLQSGGVYTRNLIRFLDRGQPMYVHSPLPFVEQGFPRSFEAMAGPHLEMLRRVQPRGPYMLGGLCNGGHVAFEVARRLQAEGEVIDVVVLIRATGANVRHRIVDRALGAVGRVFRLDQDWPRRRFLQWLDFLVELKHRSGPGRLTFTLSKLPRVAGRLVRRTANGENAPARTAVLAEDALDASRRGAAYLRLERGFMPRRYSGRIILFWPEDDDEDPDEAAAHWNKVADHVELHVLPGTHRTCVTKHAPALARELSACLERATPRPSGKHSGVVPR